MKLFIGYFLNYLYNTLITHIPIHFIRLYSLKCMGASLHSSVVVLMHSKILHPWNLSVAKNVVINQYVVLDCRRYPITIDHNSDIGPYTHIWTLGHDPHHNNHEIKGGPVHIGHHVWVASGVTILPNLEIGNGAVVAASAVVTKTIPELKIVAGNPAVVIKDRKNALTYTLQYTPIFE